MIVLDNTVLSDDIKDEKFVCDLLKCKGACCIEGDLGAPLEQQELAQVDECLEAVRPYLSKVSNRVLDKDGAYELDFEGEYSTTTIKGKEGVFAIYDNQGILKCGIEQAYFDKKTDFRKPISCHLYPIRITKYDHYDALNYDRWDICAPACQHGEDLKVPIYKFLKGPLIRKYGEDWYQKLQTTIEEGGNINE